MKFVKIKSLELTNYRQFADEKIKFNIDDKKNIIVIEGKNGFGKSNIFNAINWCFFGVEEHLRPDDRSLPICNTKEFNKLKPNKSIETIVKVILHTDEGEKEIERRAVTYKNEHSKHYQEDGKLKIMEQVDKNWKAAPYPEYIISRILPRNMRHFFFIDGEKLRQLFENIDSTQVKQSIFDLSQVTLLQHAIDHLNSYKAAFRKTVQDDPNLNLVSDIMQRQQDKINREKQEREKIVSELDTACINKKKLDEELEKVGDKNVQELETQRKEVEGLIVVLENSHNEKKTEYTQYLFKIAPAVFAKKSINQTLELIEKLESTDELPPKIQATFLEELLKKNKCICGTDLSKEENKARREKLEQLLNKSRYSGIVNDTMELKFALKNSSRDMRDVQEKITDFELKMKKIEEEIEENQKRLKEIVTKIGNIDCAKIKAVHEQRQTYKSAIYEGKGKLGRIEQGIRMDEDQYREAEKQYNLMLAKQKKYQAIKEKIDICDESIRQLDIIKTKIMDEIRNEIETRTKEFFGKLITAKNFDNIKIEKNYELVVQKDGFNAVTSLSAAETLCMGYSFMSALRSTSGFLAPIVIDTPLAKIDIEYRKNVADWFKKALTEVQVILLVTDAEYTAGFKQEIKPVVSQELILKHDETKGISEVVKYDK